jgi:hypothetical protein
MEHTPEDIFADIERWGGAIDEEPRSEGKLVDTIGKARQRGDCDIVLAGLRAGMHRVLIARAGLEAAWQLVIDRPLHPPDRRGHGQFDIVNISCLLEGGVVGLALQAAEMHLVDPKIVDTCCALIAAIARADPAAPRAIADAGGIEIILQGMERHRNECHVQYQAAAAIRSLIDGGHEVLAMRFVAANAIEALVLGMAAWPNAAVVQGAACWAVFLLIPLTAPLPGPEYPPREEGLAEVVSLSSEQQQPAEAEQPKPPDDALVDAAQQPQPEREPPPIGLDKELEHERVADDHSYATAELFIDAQPPATAAEEATQAESAPAVHTDLHSVRVITHTVSYTCVEWSEVWLT